MAEIAELDHPCIVPATVRCAGPGCDQIRREVNHWFVVRVAGQSFTCSPYCAPAAPASRPALEMEERTVCGQQCAQKLFEQYFGECK